MQLNVKPVTKKLPEFSDVCNLMKRAFPKDELISMSLWRILAIRKNIHFFVVYDDKQFIGIVYIAKYKNYVYIPFLAICENERNKNYGSIILQWIKDNYSSTLVLHIEPLDQSAKNYEQRVRRAKFYRKNGIDDTHYKFKFLGVSFSVYSSDPNNFDVLTHKKLMKWFSFHLLKFDFKRE